MLYISKDLCMQIARAALDTKTKMTMAQAHGRLRHCNEDAELRPGTLKPCEACVPPAKQNKRMYRG
jgi:hypothetical protein